MVQLIFGSEKKDNWATRAVATYATKLKDGNKWKEIKQAFLDKFIKSMRREAETKDFYAI